MNSLLATDQPRPRLSSNDSLIFCPRQRYRTQTRTIVAGAHVVVGPGMAGRQLDGTAKAGNRFVQRLQRLVGDTRVRMKHGNAAFQANVAKDLVSRRIVEVLVGLRSPTRSTGCPDPVCEVPPTRYGLFPPCASALGHLAAEGLPRVDDQGNRHMRGCAAQDALSPAAAPPSGTTSADAVQK